jgi:hypothetical protein
MTGAESTGCLGDRRYSQADGHQLVGGVPAADGARVDARPADGTAELAQLDLDQRGRRPRTGDRQQRVHAVVVQVAQQRGRLDHRHRVLGVVVDRVQGSHRQHRGAVEHGCRRRAQGGQQRFALLRRAGEGQADCDGHPPGERRGHLGKSRQLHHGQ